MTAYQIAAAVFLAIETDVFFSEKSPYGDRWIDSALARLQSEGLIHKGALEPQKGKRPDGWKPREQTPFRTTEP